MIVNGARYRQTGSPREVLAVEDFELPDPGPGHVQVQVDFSGINPTDVKARGGRVASVINEFQVPHHDGAGVITAVGEGVSPDRIGERVWVMLAASGNRYGTAASFCNVASEFARLLPGNVPLELGATLGVPAVTAAYALFSDGPIAGTTVLISGGAGAVGRVAIELAKWAGARVVTTVSSESKAKIARAAGADLVVDYTQPEVANQLAGQAISRVVEVNLAANMDLDIEISQPGMKIVSYAADGDDPVIPRRKLMTACITIEFMLLYNVEKPKFWAAVESVEYALAAGALTMPPVQVLPLADIATAHELVESAAPSRILIETRSHGD